jgi:hypothetical protein
MRERFGGGVVIDPCLDCGLSTAFGSGRFVDRIPADREDYETGEYRDGFLCAMCAGYECDKCGEQIYIDTETRAEDARGFVSVFHAECSAVVL